MIVEFFILLNFFKSNHSFIINDKIFPISYLIVSSIWEEYSVCCFFHIRLFLIMRFVFLDQSRVFVLCPFNINQKQTSWFGLTSCSSFRCPVQLKLRQEALLGVLQEEVKVAAVQGPVHLRDKCRKLTLSSAGRYSSDTLRDTRCGLEWRLDAAGCPS